MDLREDGGKSSLDIDSNGWLKKASIGPSVFLNEFIERNLARLTYNEEVRSSYAMAIIMASKLWVRTPNPEDNTNGILLRRPCSPEHIRLVTRLGLKDQTALKILLNKTDALTFLKGMGRQINSDSSFKKAYSNDKAGAKLGRKTAFLSGNMLLCTYAEWLYMEGFAFEPRLPEILFELVPEGWKCPDPEETPGANLPLEG